MLKYLLYVVYILIGISLAYGRLELQLILPLKSR